MRIEVTQEHIDNGVRKDAGCCPVGLALKDAGVQDPDVQRSFARWEEVSGEWRRTKLPELPAAAQLFIERFDAGEPVRPFTFRLEETYRVPA